MAFEHHGDGHHSHHHHHHKRHHRHHHNNGDKAHTHPAEDPLLGGQTQTTVDPPKPAQ
jgi:hypothetical protein